MKRILSKIIVITILVFFCWCCCGGTLSQADTQGCLVICEVPEEPVRYTIPKIKGRGYFYLEQGQVLYKEIEYG